MDNIVKLLYKIVISRLERWEQYKNRNPITDKRGRHLYGIN